MTKLLCPKGHETCELKNEVSTTVGFERLWCDDCGRPYLKMDCLTEPHVNDINVVETKVNPLEMQWVNPKRESQVAIERVIEALSYAVDRDDPWFFNIGWEECCDSLGFKVINRFKNKLKEINK